MFYIELVREHPHLYNPRLPEHRDVQLIHDTWGSIAEVLAVEHPHLYNPRLPEHRDVQLIHNTWGRIAELLAVEKLCGKYVTLYRSYSPCAAYMRFSGHTCTTVPSSHMKDSFNWLVYGYAEKRVQTHG